MYNRYIGNTGKYYRVEDVSDYGHRPVHDPPPDRGKDRDSDRARDRDREKPGGDGKWNPKSFAKSFPDFSENLRHTIKDKMPAGIDIGDILLILVLLFLFLEGEDDEMLIILVILIIMWVGPLFIKDKS